MIGYKMGTLVAGVYTLVENFKHEWKNDMLANMTTFYWGSSPEVKFLGNLKMSDKKLSLQRTPPWLINTLFMHKFEPWV